ncbi:hypothetical protein Y788_18785 [Pantoea dispersa 625]|nr:hypothetical protein Y788_18785 [Pantoea dispersa 625]
MSVPGKVIDSPFFKYCQHSLTYMPMRHDTYALMFFGALEIL